MAESSSGNSPPNISMMPSISALPESSLHEPINPQHSSDELVIGKGEIQRGRKRKHEEYSDVKKPHCGPQMESKMTAGSIGHQTSKSGQASAGSTGHQTSNSGPTSAGSTGHQTSNSGPSSAGSTGHQTSTSGPTSAGSTGHQTSKSEQASAGSTGHQTSNSGPTSAGSIGHQMSKSGQASADSTGHQTSNSGPTSAGSTGHQVKSEQASADSTGHQTSNSGPPSAGSTRHQTSTSGPTSAGSTGHQVKSGQASVDSTGHQTSNSGPTSAGSTGHQTSNSGPTSAGSTGHQTSNSGPTSAGSTGHQTSNSRQTSAGSTRQGSDHYQKSRPTNSVGFHQAAKEGSITISLKAILPKAAWYWNESTSQVYIRFGIKQLGDWKYNFGPGKVRDFGDGLSVVRFKVHIDVDVLKHSKGQIQYKYYVSVLSRDAKDARPPFEYLYGATQGSGHKNRVLKIHQDKIAPGAHILQFDTMIFPEVKDKSNIFKRFINYAFGATSNPPEFSVPPIDEMRQQCMTHYLDPFKYQLLTGQFKENFELFEVVDNFAELYQCCLCQYYGCSESQNQIYPWKEPKINVAIKEWLQGTIDGLAKESSWSPGKLVAAVVLMCCSHRVCHGEIAIFSLLKMITLPPTGDGFESLTSFMKEKKSHCLVEQSLIELINVAIEVQSNAVCILKALPLLHFLREDCIIPHQQMFILPSQIINWKDPFLKLNAMKVTKGCVLNEELQSLFSLDPLLILAVMYICPLSDISSLCATLYLPYAIALVVKKTEGISALGGSKLVDNVVCNPMTILLKRVNDEENILSLELERCLEAISTLFSILLIKSTSANPTDTKCIKVSISLILCVMARIHLLPFSRDSAVSEGIQLIENLLKGWIVKGGVIGGTKFGGDHYKTQFEIKVWKNLLGLYCPQCVEEDWHQLVTRIVTDRVKRITPREKCIEVFCDLEEKHTDTPIQISDVFMTETAILLDDLKPAHFLRSNKSISRLMEIKSERVICILGNTLRKKYPNFNEVNRISQDDLLEWEYWSSYIKIYASRAGVTTQAGDWQVICMCALSRLVSVVQNICTGDISIVELRKVIHRKSQLHKLIDAVSGHEQATSMPSVKDLDVQIVQRMQEFDEFLLMHEQMHSLFCSLSTVRLQGAEQVLACLQADDHNTCSINTLCSSDGQNYHIHCFPADTVHLESCLALFWHMTQKVKCEIFTRFWNARLSELNEEKCNLTMADVFPVVWTPVFYQCEELLAKLKDYSLSLSKVDILFNGMSTECIVQNIKELQKGVEWCQNRRQVHDFKWIHKVIFRMNKFWKLSKGTVAAQVLLEIKEALGLTGDFQLVEVIASQGTSSMKDNQTLLDIDESVACAADFLQGFDERKRECLRAFAESLTIVKWIRDETKDLNGLQSFVVISLTTAAGGEDAYTRDRLSYLRTVGSGFKDLIYNLPSSAGYQVLVNQCQSLWDTLRTTPNLPDMMRDCAKKIDWYQSVKKTQGSVEETSYGQMNSIKLYGSYIIGSGKKIHANQSQVIQLTLSGMEKRLPKTSYSLDDLSDLESKLVLITGRESDEAKGVDVFLQSLVCVRRIADALMALQQHGSGYYIGWKMTFPCALPNVVEELQKVANKMEDDLEKWKQEIQEKRDEFYELNYYTTQQLLLLREELGRLKETGEDQVKPYAMALLQSISREVSADAMKRYVQEAVVKKEPVKGIAVTSCDLESILEHPSIIEKTSSSPPSALITDILKKKSSAPVALKQEADLSDDQKSILANIVANFEYHPQLILLALERCGNPKDIDEVVSWCMDHEDTYSYEEESDDNEDIDAVMVEEGEMEITPVHSDEEETEEVLGTKMELIAESSANVIIREHVSVNEHHPVVKELHTLEYPLEQCIYAAERFPEDSYAAHNFLQQIGERGNLFGDEAIEQPLDTLQCSESTTTESVNANQIVINKISSRAKSYLTLLELGKVLKVVSEVFPSPLQSRRSFNENVLKIDEPNVVVTTPDNVIKTTLALYMEGSDQSLPMPTYEEVLVCSERTTDEEVTLLWKRAINDPSKFRLFCLVHAERLSYQVCDRALPTLFQLSQGHKDYRIVIICCSEEEEKSHVISKLQSYRRPYSVLHQPNSKFAEYLLRHFQRRSKVNNEVFASVVDPDGSYVRIVTSQRAGMGKSLYIKRRSEALKVATTNDQHFESQEICEPEVDDEVEIEAHKAKTTSYEVIVPIHGPVVTADTVVGALKEHIGKSRPIIFHLDIAPNVLWQVDSILFCLLVLQGLCDSQGNVWRCHPAHLYMIESTIPKGGEGRAASRTTTLFKLLPSVECVSPRHLNAVQLQPNCVSMDDAEYHSTTYQRVYQYLKVYTQSKASLDQFTYESGSVEGSTNDCVQILLRQCGVKDPSWMELNHFLKFLDIQLSSCEGSPFCSEALISDVLSGFKTFVVKFMIRMSKDFATSSLKGEVATENEEEAVMGTLEEYTIAERKEWEKSYHPYLFFNSDGFSMTFVGFNANRNGDLIDPANNTCIEGLERAVGRQLYTGLTQNGVNLRENYRLWDKVEMMKKISSVMGLDFLSDPDPSYVLTVDNVIKILAIQMRFRCNIPVVVMGETGCGKTRLIRFMCDMIARGAGGGIDSIRNMLIMKVHGGTTEQDVRNKVVEAEELAKLNKGKGIDTILFFDEANTTEAIGLIKEVMCDRRVYGREISRDVNFIAACNPYRKHTEEMISKLESAGLGFYVKATETQQKLGKIPLRQLVYRVLELPPSMRPLVYDFGQLTNTTEQDYTKQIVTNHCSRTHSQQIITAVSHVLAWCQKFMRDKEDECSFVSLRDVERAMIVFKFFISKFELFKDLIAAKAKNDTPLQDVPTWSLVLTISICYHARLQKRKDFERGVVQQFSPPLALTGGVQQFKDEIKWCQEILLENMILGPNIAKNAALRENVFMMTISVELRIPLFLVGKPGSSKSLAKSIVAASMHGRASEKDLLKQFKTVHMFSYQCSQLSTPESVIEVFKTAKSFQEKQDTSNFVSIVVLDEVGLAEDSPNLPLKALHPLLEDGTEGADDSKQIVAREKRVAFIGISNWALDPAKMNRGVMVTRGDPEKKELELSARGICSNMEDDPIKMRLQKFFAPLAEAYIEICKKQERQFYGLRDFYSLVKMLYWMCEKTQSDPTSEQLEHAIKRNFGGHLKLNAFEIFKSKISQFMTESTFKYHIPEEQRVVMYPDCTPLGLIRTSLKTKETTWHGENRYLLFLTENYAALQILKRYLQEVVGLPAASRGPVGEAGGLEGPGVEEELERQKKREQRKMEPFVLFGSSFRKDKEYTQVCRNINQIKICMETGRTVILLNLENLYESLYDLLNQYYITFGNNRYVDLGLQTHRVKCRVHEDFKLILIAEKDTVYEKFPIPLINRLEKHFVLTRTVLLPWQERVLDTLIEWVQQFSRVGRFTEKDSFVGYQNDTPASVVFQATEQLREELGWEVDEAMEESEEWLDMVLQHSKGLLIQMASPDALIRAHSLQLACTQLAQKSSTNNFMDMYFEQHRGSIQEFICHNLNSYHLKQEKKEGWQDGGLLLHVTTYSHLLSSTEMGELRHHLKFSRDKIKGVLLQEFDTEMDFSNKIRSMFERRSREDSLLIIQCDSGHLYSDLIACARYRVDDEREKSSHLWSAKYGKTHVLFVVHLPRPGEGNSDRMLGSFVGFQGGKWLSAHIDDLRAPSEATLNLQDVLGSSISDLFYSVGNVSSNEQKEDAPKIEVEMQNEDPEIVIEESELQGSEKENILAVKNSEGSMAEIHEVVRSEEWTDEDDKDNEEVEMIAVEKNEIDKKVMMAKQVQDEELESNEEMEQEEEVAMETELQIEDEDEISLAVTEEQEMEEEDSFEEGMLAEAQNEETTIEGEVKEQLAVQEEQNKVKSTADTMLLAIKHEEKEEIPEVETEWIHKEEEEDMSTDEVSVDSMIEDPIEIESRVSEEEEVDFTAENKIDTTPMVYMTVTSAKGSYQCSRLYDCIQAAVARVVSSEKSKEWGSRRITILLDLIPQRPMVPLICVWLHPPLSDKSYFYATLVRHIHSVLKEREEMIEEDTGWVLEEAMDRKKLQSGGTFRNVLSRKLDKVIIPIFAEVLISVDRYSNLDLVRKSSPHHIRQLWLSAFPVLCKFSYADMTTQGGDGLAGMGQKRSTGSEFRCQFPFFWLVKETVDSHWDNTVVSVTGGHYQQVHWQLCQLLAGTDIREVLDSVSEEKEWKELYQFYLSDYIMCMHQVPHHQSSLEYKLISAALDAIITSPDLFPPNSPHPPLLSRVAAVHTAYHHYQRELLWFGRLTTCFPGILLKLHGITHNPQKIELHFEAVNKALDDHLLIPPLSAENRKNLPQWLGRIQLCQNVISSIITTGQGTERLVAGVNATWQRVRAVQMFVEHVIIKYDIGLEAFGKRLDFSLLKGNSDFTTAKTVAAVKKLLQSMDGELEKGKKYKLAKNMLNSIRESCRAFFMELVSTLCFGQTTLPEPDLISSLMNIVFQDDEKTKDFTYSDKAAADKQPVIRSFLLQLLLEHDNECVKGHLEQYFEQSCHVSGKDVHQLSLLCIQCFEDALFKQHTQHTLQQRINHSLQLLKDGSEGMVSHSFPTLPYLEAVAKLRYSLSVVAELLHTQLTAGRGEGGGYSLDVYLLIEETKQCCSTPQLNQEEAGPGVYLVKLLMRQYGPSFLSTLTSDPTLQWVVPEHLRQSDDKENQRIDRFVIYNPHYTQLRTALLNAAYGRKMDELDESCQGLTPSESVPVLLAVYEVVTQSHSYFHQSKHIDNEVVENIFSFIKSLTMLNRELKWTAEALIRNTQGEKLDALCCQPGHTSHTILLSAVVVHTAITIYSRSTLDIMLPLFNMVEKPGDLQHAYLPTFAQDALPEVRRVLGGSFYECPKGHPYFISECGNPMQEWNCPQCGLKIGGKQQVLQADNRPAKQIDTTQTGYALGFPEQRETLPFSERSLSPAACAILRAIMHSALLWATCNNENAMEGLNQLTHAAVRPPDMAGFFWRHLEHDITILGQAVGKSDDDVCLLLHLILKNMAMKTPALTSEMQVYGKMLSTNAREQWEKCFEQEYIQPVLSGLDKQMGDAMNLILNDKKDDRDRLFYTVYEKSSLPSSSLLPHLWTYRSRITLEYLFQTLQAQKMKDTCPILHEFLKEEPILRATRYLPELVQLQKQMFDFSHRRLDRKEVAKLPVQDYIKSLPDHKKKQFLELLRCVKIVWELVQDKLSEYARVRVPEEYLGMVISEELKVEWFIPTLTGPGVVTVAMLDLLVGAHNDFIEKSRAVLKKGQKTEINWKEQNIPVSHVQLCHLLDYEHQLLSIVLSHCRYSLRHGHGQDIRYDLPALEKHIVDRFIHGKPLLMLEIPQVVYRRDVYTATSFANIRKKVSPQIKLSLREQQEIVAELKTMQIKRECLDEVEIVMGFLASGGQKAENRLDDYLEKALKTKRRFHCKKALEYCCLGHVLSLWETLSVELAKQLTLSGQEPFDSLHDNYLVELGDKEKELNRVLAKCDLPVLLCTLYEFIETNVRHREPREHDWELVDTLEAHLDQYSLPQLPDLHQLPADITIGQAVSTWKHIVIYQHRKNTRGQYL